MWPHSAPLPARYLAHPFPGCMHMSLPAGIARQGRRPRAGAPQVSPKPSSPVVLDALAASTALLSVRSCRNVPSPMELSPVPLPTFSSPQHAPVFVGPIGAAVLSTPAWAVPWLPDQPYPGNAWRQPSSSASVSVVPSRDDDDDNDNCDGDDCNGAADSDSGRSEESADGSSDGGDDVSSPQPPARTDTSVDEPARGRPSRRARVHVPVTTSLRAPVTPATAVARKPDTRDDFAFDDGGDAYDDVGAPASAAHTSKTGATAPVLPTARPPAARASSAPPRQQRPGSRLASLRERLKAIGRVSLPAPATKSCLRTPVSQAARGDRTRPVPRVRFLLSPTDGGKSPTVLTDEVEPVGSECPSATPSPTLVSPSVSPVPFPVLTASSSPPSVLQPSSPTSQRVPVQPDPSPLTAPESRGQPPSGIAQLRHALTQPESAHATVPQPAEPRAPRPPAHAAAAGSSAKRPRGGSAEPAPGGSAHPALPLSADTDDSDTDADGVHRLIAAASSAVRAAVTGSFSSHGDIARVGGPRTYKRIKPTRPDV